MARQTPTISAASERFLHTLRMNDRSQATIANYRSILRRLATHTGDIQVGHLRREHLEDFFFGPGGIRFVHRTSQTRGEMQPSSYNRAVGLVRAFIRWCAGEGYVHRSTDLFGNVGERKVVQRERLHLSVRELRGLLDAALSPRDRTFIATLVALALRASEAVDLRLSDVDLDAGRVHVFVRKSSLEDRMVIGPGLSKELRPWLTIYAAQAPRPLRPDDYLFPSRQPNQFAKINGVWRSASGDWIPERRMNKPARVVQEAMAQIGYAQGFQERVTSTERAKTPC